MTEEFQVIKSPLPVPTIALDPSQAKKRLFSNVIRQVIAVLYGVYGGNPIPLLADANSRLLVTGIDSTPLSWEVFAGTAGDAWTPHTWGAAGTWGFVILAETKDLDVKGAKVSGGDTDTVRVPADTAVSLPGNMVSCSVKAHTTGETPVYQVIALMRG